MKTARPALSHTEDIESILSVCGGIPQGDELPQVAGEEDIIMDVYSDILDMPRQYATAAVHHQFDDGLDYDDMIH